MSALERRCVASAQDAVTAEAERPLWLCRLQVKFGNQTLPCFLLRDGLKNRIERKERVAGKIHLRHQARNERPSENGEMDVRRPPRIVVIEPGICTRLDCHEPIRSS